eukprot:gb/GECG01010535.1/.p1 GENE.gb/GECG01010535.1/~~gb/GECG01010535.1/.p1  ORF type:complete len:1642 (+),score=242.13 gb/GECG01010535.1/:1-4926(+)
MAHLRRSTDENGLHDASTMGDVSSSSSLTRKSAQGSVQNREGVEEKGTRTTANGEADHYLPHAPESNDDYGAQTSFSFLEGAAAAAGQSDGERAAQSSNRPSARSSRQSLRHEDGSKASRAESFSTESTRISDHACNYRPSVDVNLTSVSTFPNDRHSIMQEVIGNAKDFAGGLSEGIGFTTDEEDHCFSFVPKDVLEDEGSEDETDEKDDTVNDVGKAQRPRGPSSSRDLAPIVARPAPVTSSVGGMWSREGGKSRYVNIERSHSSNEDDEEFVTPVTTVGRGRSHLTTLVRTFAMAHANAFLSSTPAFSASATDATSFSSFETYDYYPPPLSQLQNATHWPEVDKKSFNDYISRLRSVRAREELPHPMETCLRTIISASAVAHSDDSLSFLRQNPSVARKLLRKHSKSSMMENHFASESKGDEVGDDLPVWLERRLEDAGEVFRSRELADISHFHAVIMGWWPYLRSVNDAYRILQFQESSKNDETASPDMQSKLNEIPKVFFDPQFDLKTAHYFNLLCLDSDEQERGTSSRDLESAVFDSRIFSMLSKHLDVVENDLSNRVRSRKDTLFHALSMLQVLRDKLSETFASVARLKDQVSHTKKTKAEKMLHILLLRRRSERMKKYKQLLHNIKEILSLKIEVRDRYSRGEYRLALHILAHIGRCLRNVVGDRQASARDGRQLAAFPGMMRNNDRLRQSVGNTLIKRFTRSSTRLISAGANASEVADMIDKLCLSETQATAVNNFLRGWSRDTSKVETNFATLQSVADTVRDNLDADPRYLSENPMESQVVDESEAVSDDACVEAVLHFGILPLVDALLLADVHSVVDEMSIGRSGNRGTGFNKNSQSLLQAGIEGCRTQIIKEIRTVMKLEVGEYVRMLQSSALDEDTAGEEEEDADEGREEDDIDIGGNIGVKRAELRSLSVSDFHKVFSAVVKALIGVLRRVSALHACICHVVNVYENDIESTASSDVRGQDIYRNIGYMDLEKLKKLTISDAKLVSSSVQSILTRIPAVSYGVLVSSCDCVMRQLVKLISVRKPVHRELSVESFIPFLQNARWLSASVQTLTQRASGTGRKDFFRSAESYSGSSSVVSAIKNLYDTIFSQMLKCLETMHESYRESLQAYLQEEKWKEAPVPQNCQFCLLEVAYLAICPELSLKSVGASVEFRGRRDTSRAAGDDPRVMHAEEEYSEDCVQLIFKSSGEKEARKNVSEEETQGNSSTERLIRVGNESLSLNWVTDSHKLLLMPTLGEDKENESQTNEIHEIACKCKRFRIVSSGAALIKMAFEYVEAAQLISQYEDSNSTGASANTSGGPNSSKSIVMMIAQLLRDFHQQVDSLILGAGAVSNGTLRTITARHLALTLQTLSTTAAFIPLLRSALTKCLPPAEHAKLQQLWVISKDYSDHIDRLLSKFASIVQDLITSDSPGGLGSLAAIDWNKLGDDSEFDEAYLAISGDELLKACATRLPDTPRLTQTTGKFLKSIQTLHRILAPILSQPQSEDVFGRVAVTLSAQIPVACVSLEFHNLSEPSNSARIRRYKLSLSRQADGNTQSNSTVTFDSETEELLNRHDEDDLGLSTAGRARLAWDIMLLVKSLKVLPCFNMAETDSDGDSMTTGTMAMSSLVAWMERQFNVRISLEQLLAA